MSTTGKSAGPESELNMTTETHTFSTDRTIIAGSRSFQDYNLAWAVMADLGWDIKTVLTDCAVGKAWAKAHGVAIEEHPADWERLAEVADACIVFWDGTSKGSKHMIDIAQKHGLLVKVINL
jgi:hypothetical protein